MLDRALRAHLDRATGVLEFETAGRTRRLYLRQGEMHLSPESPFAEAVRQLGDSADATRWSPLLAKLVEGYFETKPRDVQWHDGVPPPRGAAGPLPTEALLRRAFAASGAATDLEGELVADFDERDLAGAPACWSPEELWVFERLRRAMRFDALRVGCPFPEPRLRAVVVGLAAVGRVHGSTRAPSTPQDSGLLRLVELLGARVEASLRDRPLGLLDDALRRRLEAVARGAETKNHYELLGLAADAESDAIQEAFESLARIVHPVHAQRQAVGVPRATLARLFERAVAAYRTLGDPALRAAYDASHEVARGSEETAGAARREEMAALARREFDRARFEEVNGDLHSALVLYEQVVELDPTSDHLVALARLQAKNPVWTGRALATIRRALELDPANAELLFLCGELYERGGQLERAAGYYGQAAESPARHEGARAALRRLAERGVGKAKEGGAFGRLFRRE